VDKRHRYSIAPAMWREFFDAHFHPERYSFAHAMTSSLNFFLTTLTFNGFPVPHQEVGVRDAVCHIGDLVSDGWSILIFPEGGRSTTGEIEAFVPGVGMRLKTACPGRADSFVGRRPRLAPFLQDDSSSAGGDGLWISAET